MSIKTEVWGKSPEGKDVHKFTMMETVMAPHSITDTDAPIALVIVNL